MLRGGAFPPHLTLRGVKMTEKNTYLTLRPEEKEVIHEAKRQDPRFADDSRVADGAYVALALREYMEELTE